MGWRTIKTIAGRAIVGAGREAVIEVEGELFRFVDHKSTTSGFQGSRMSRDVWPAYWAAEGRSGLYSTACEAEADARRAFVRPREQQAEHR